LPADLPFEFNKDIYDIRLISRRWLQLGCPGDRFVRVRLNSVDKIKEHMRIVRILILVTTLASCSDKVEEMDVWESEVSEKLKADRVELYHRNTTTSTDGQFTGAESYLVLDIYNSEVLAKIQHNDRLLTKKSDEIKDLVLSVPTLDAYPDFNEIRLGLVETRGFGIFKSEKTNTITYRIR